jgi:hypothetical protein
VPKAFHREFSGVMIDSNAHPALIGGNIIDAIGRHLARCGVDKVMDANLLGLPYGLPFLPAIFAVPDQLLLLGVDRNHRVSARLVLGDHVGDVAELCVAVGVLPTCGSIAGCSRVASAGRRPSAG